MYGTKLFLTLYINIVLKSAVLKVGSLAFFRTVSPCTKCMFLKTALLVQTTSKKVSWHLFSWSNGMKMSEQIFYHLVQEKRWTFKI